MTFSLTLLTQFLEDMEAYSEVGDHLLHMLVLDKLEYKGTAWFCGSVQNILLCYKFGSYKYISTLRLLELGFFTAWNEKGKIDVSSKGPLSDYYRYL